MPKIDPSAAVRATGSRYPAPFDEPCKQRMTTRLGDVAGLTQFGVNLVRLPPGAWSGQRHWHSHEDEFVYVLEGEVTLVTNAGEEALKAGDSAGFKGGTPDGHSFQNRSRYDVVLLVAGARIDGDYVVYSDIDMQTAPRGDSPGKPLFRHKDGTPY